jgi:hypothetical protein
MFRLAILITSIIVFLSGCASTHKLTIDPQVDTLPHTTEFPLHAGIYYSQQFSSQVYSRTTGSSTFTVPIGAASVKMFDNVIPKVFEKTTRITDITEAELVSKGIDVVIAPSLEHFDFFIGFDKDSDRYSVVYRMTLYTNKEVPATSWLVSGDKPSKAFGIWRMIEDDMEDAALSFLMNFEHDAKHMLEVIRKNETANIDNVDMHNIIFTAKQTAMPGLDSEQLATMQEAGIIAIEVDALNKNERSLVVNASSMRLKLGNGQLVEPLTVSSALSVLDKTSYTGDKVAAFIGAPFGLLATYAEQQSSQEEREQQYRTGNQSLFGDRLMANNKMESGIVLFYVPKDMINLKDSACLIWVIDPSTAIGKHAEIAISVTH